MQGRGVSESENKKKKKKRDRVRVGGRETERAEGHLEGEEDKAGEKQQKNPDGKTAQSLWVAGVWVMLTS